MGYLSFFDLSKNKNAQKEIKTKIKELFRTNNIDMSLEMCFNFYKGGWQ